MSGSNSNRALGRGLSSLIVVPDQPDQLSPSPSPVPALSIPTEPLTRLGQITIQPIAGRSSRTLALGSHTVTTTDKRKSIPTTTTTTYYLVDEAFSVDAFGGSSARVVSFDTLVAADLVQVIGEMYVRVMEQEKVIEELRERERLMRATKLGK